MKQGAPADVIWITTDHMRWDCIGAHGNAAIHTPNLDALVKSGVTFERCYANNPLCMPSRCSFMTGCYPTQTGVVRNGQELPADFRPTVATTFGEAGYETVQIGKLHFQGHEDHDLDPRARHDYGFDILQLSEEPGCYEDAYRTWLRGEFPEYVNTLTVPRPASRERHYERTQYKVLDVPAEASHSGWIASQFDRSFASWGKRPRPQFLHLGFYAPHPPLNPTREMFAPYAGMDMPEPNLSAADWNRDESLDKDTLVEYKRHFYAMVTGVDMAIGRILETLRETGSLENTLIVFGSDHGDVCGDHGQIGKGTSFYEGIMRLPLVMHWPEGLGTECRRVREMVEMVDVLPTMLGLCGAEPHSAMQGRNYAPALVSGDPVAGRRDVYAFHGDGELMLRTEDYKYIRYQAGDNRREVLYNLDRDPDEFRNVAGDPEEEPVLADLRERALTRHINASRSILPVRTRF